MPSIPLTLRDRFSLVGRALAGQLSLDPSSVGGRLLGGIIQAGGQPPIRGTREYLQSYSTMPWLRAVASRVSYDIAATEWEVLIERRAGRAVRNRQLQRMKAPQRDILVAQMKEAGELDAMTDHPLIDLLNDFNPVQTGLMGRRTTQLHLDLVGEAFWLLERGALDQIIAIWPVPPSWILGTPTPRFPFYRVSFRGWQGTIPETEFIHFSDVDPANPYGRGTGTAQALADELETDEYAAKHLKAFFHNHARPDLIVWPKGDQPIREDEVRRLEEQWISHSGGFWRKFRPFFLKREVEIKELDQNFRSQQMVQLREYERNCYDDQTEALTRRGWVRGVELREDDEVLSWHPLWQRFVYQVPRRIVRYPHTGEMHHWKNQRVDVCVTPNHRMLVTYPGKDKWAFRRSDACAAMHRLEWRIAGAHPGGGETNIQIPNVRYGVRTQGHHEHSDDPYYQFDTTTFGRWLGYWLAEGSLTNRTNERGEPDRFGLSYGQTQEASELEPVGVVADMVATAEALRVAQVRVRRVRQLTVAGRACYNIEFSNRSVWQWVHDNCGIGAKNKRLPRCVFSWIADAQRVLLDAMIEGDGCRYATGAWYSTASQQLADDVQELGVLLGLRTALRQSGSMFYVQLTTRQTAWVRGDQCTNVAYSGDIWCVDIEGDAFVTRRNGKIAVHGNTILQVYGVSPETLGIIGPGSNRATITMNDSIYSRRVLVPRLELLRSVKQERLVPLFDERIIIHYVSPVVKDQELELEAGKIAPWALTVDEWRARQGVGPLEDDRGQVHLVSSVLLPTRFDEASGPSPIPDRPSTPDESSRSRLPAVEADVTTFITQAELDAKWCDEAGDSETARLLRTYQKQARFSSSDDPVPTQLADRQTVAYRRSQERSWQALSHRADVNALERAIAANRADEVLEAFGGPTVIVASLVDVLRARGKPAFLRGAALAMESLPPSAVRTPVAINLSDVNPEATRWAEREAARLIVASADAQAAIRELIVLSNETGIAPREVARRIVRDHMVSLLPRQVTAVERFRQRLRDDGVDAETVTRRTSRYAAAQLRARAWSIARTELVSAVNAGQDALWQLAKQRGVLSAETKRVWLVTLDDALDSHVCFVGRTPVLTLDGWKPISKIRAGEYVLTHRDRFRQVTKTMSRWHNGNAVRIVFGGRERVQATATANHPILTRRGWIPAGKLTAEDEIAVSAKPCARCGDLIPYGPGTEVALCRPCRPIVANEKIWADPAQHERVQQQNARRWSNPAQRAAASELMRQIASNPTDETRARLAEHASRRFSGNGNPSKRLDVRLKRSEQERKKIRAGTHPFLAKNRTYVARPLTLDQIAARTAAVKAWHAALTPEQKRAKLSAMMAGNSRSARGSKAERRLREWLDTHSLAYVPQWPFAYRDGKQERNGFADFLLPGARLVVECDGWFHFNDLETQRRDHLRDVALHEQGLSVLRVNARDIERDLPSVASQIRAYCCLTWLKPKQIACKTIRHQPVYNLEVAEDHSYVAGGLVAHNCEPLTDAEAGLDEPFQPGGFLRPPAHPQCRCALGLKTIPRRELGHDCSEAS